MASKYYIRNEEGHLKMSVSVNIAGKILATCPGFWREYNAKDKPATSCYEFTDDVSFGVEEFRLFIWKGDVLIPVD